MSGSIFAVSAFYPIETLATSIPSVLILDCDYYKVSLRTMLGGHHPTKRLGVENKSFAGMRAPSIEPGLQLILSATYSLALN